MSIAIRIALILAALWVLHRELIGITVRDLAARFTGYGVAHVLLGLTCTVGSFVVLGMIEMIALRATLVADASRDAINVRLRKTMSIAFVANALSQSIGVSIVTASAVRAREYARFGLDVAAVARVTAFATVSTTLGLMAMSAWALSTNATPLHIGRIDIPLREIGVLLAGVVVAYFAWAGFGKSASREQGRWSLPRPSLKVAVAQVGLSAFDWILSATVLFAFIPVSLDIGYLALVRAYLIAQAIAVTSHVPGGAGVLELVLLLLLARNHPTVSRAAIVASLVMFRLIYYVLPLIAATATLGVAELRRTFSAARAMGAAHVG